MLDRFEITFHEPKSATQTHLYIKNTTKRKNDFYSRCCIIFVRYFFWLWNWKLYLKMEFMKSIKQNEKCTRYIIGFAYYKNTPQTIYCICDWKTKLSTLLRSKKKSHEIYVKQTKAKRNWKSITQRKSCLRVRLKLLARSHGFVAIFIFIYLTN